MLYKVNQHTGINKIATVFLNASHKYSFEDIHTHRDKEYQ